MVLALLVGNITKNIKIDVFIHSYNKFYQITKALRYNYNPIWLLERRYHHMIGVWLVLVYNKYYI